MSTHILSDIEALCDEVAILRNGRLAATGKLDDLLESSGEQRTFEINVSGVSADLISENIARIGGATISEKPSGASILVASEKDIDAVLTLTRESGGNLVSVLPVRRALEDLFEGKKL
jgi:ABC-2 type transport system ATP-binding protein